MLPQLRWTRKQLQIYVKTATEYYGNTGSLHDIGSTAKEIVENCRREFAKMLGVDNQVFILQAEVLKVIILAYRPFFHHRESKDTPHIISSMAEHTSIRSTLEILAEKGCEVTLFLSMKKAELILKC